MALKNMFRELATTFQKKDVHLVDAMTEETPIIEYLPMEPTTDGLQHLHDELRDVVGAQVIQLDDVLPEVDSNSELVSQDLTVIGGLIQIGEDTAKAIGKGAGAAAGAAKYIARKLPSILRVTTMNVEIAYIYNTVLPYARKNLREQLVTSLSPLSGVNYSMMCVKYVTGETGGLYDPEGWGNGKIFDIKALDGGNVTMLEGKNGQIAGYRSRMKTYLGFLMANPRNVSSIRNIDIREDSESETGYKGLPTEAQIDRMILDARATPKNSLIYCHPSVLSALNAYKAGAMTLSPADKDIDREFYNWNGIRIITSWNFKMDEDLIS